MSTPKSSPSPARVSKPTVEKLSKSCDHCKLKKIKCNQAKPTCTNCVKYREKCVYSIMKKPGLKPGYGQHVFEKIDALDSLITKVQRQSESEDSILKEKLRRLEQKLDALEKRSSDSSGSPGAEEPFFHRENLIDYDFTPPESIQSALSSIQSEGLPTQEQCESLVDLYFQHFHPTFPVLHPIFDRQSVLKDFSVENWVLVAIIFCSLEFAESVLSSHERNYYEISLKTKIVSSCFAIKTSSELKAISLLAFSLYSKSNDNEAWSLISLAAEGCSHLGLIKETSENNLRVSISKEPLGESDQESSEWEKWVQTETLRRLVFEIYQLDRLSSISSFVSAKMHDSEITCYLPIKQEFWENRGSYNKTLVEKGQKRSFHTDFDDCDLSLIGSDTYLIEVVKLMGEIQKSLRDSPAIKDMKSVLAWQLYCYELETKIQSWKDSLDENTKAFLKGEKRLESLTVKDVILFCLYHTMIIRLNSTAAFPYFQDSFLLSSKTARAKCMKSSKAIVDFSRSLPVLFDQNENVHQIFGPYYAFSLWVSGRVVLVDNLHSENQIDEDFDYLINALQKVGTHWKCATKYADILEFFKNDAAALEKATEAGDPIESGFRSELPVVQAEDTQLISDMRLNASSLDQLLSDKIAKYKNVKGEVDDLAMFDWFKLPNALGSPAIYTSRA